MARLVDPAIGKTPTSPAESAWLGRLLPEGPLRRHARVALGFQRREHPGRWTKATGRDLAAELRDELAQVVARAALSAVSLEARAGFDADRHAALLAGLEEAVAGIADAYSSLTVALRRADRTHDEIRADHGPPEDEGDEVRAVEAIRVALTGRGWQPAGAVVAAVVARGVAREVAWAAADALGVERERHEGRTVWRLPAVGEPAKAAA